MRFDLCHGARTSGWLFILLSGCFAACGGDSAATPPEDAGPADATAGDARTHDAVVPDMARADATLEDARPLDATPPDAGPPRRLEVVVRGAGAGEPGFPVVLELLDGARLEAVTDARGSAVFAVPAGEVAGVIAHRDDFSFGAASPRLVEEHIAAEQALELIAFPISPPLTKADEVVTISGAILNRHRPNSRVAVSSTAARGLSDGLPGVATYELRVPANTPLQLVAFEWEPVVSDPRGFEELHPAWVVTPIEPLAGDLVLDLDLSNVTEPTVVTGTVAAPAHAGLRETAQLNVLSFSGGPYLGGVGWPPGRAWAGFSSSTAPRPGNTGYSFTADYVPLVGESLFTVYILSLPGGGGSMTYVDAPPADGDAGVTFLAPPGRTAPVGDGPHDFTARIGWLADPETRGHLSIGYYIEGAQVGLVRLAADDTEISLPRLPTTSTRLHDGPMFAELFACVSTDLDGGCERRATDGSFAVESPFP